MVVAYDGDATLNIGNGAVVNDLNGYIAFVSGSTGAVTMSGGGQWNHTGSMDIGTSGTANLTMTGGATMNTATVTTINSLSSLTANNGILNTGTLTGTGTIRVEETGLLLNQSGNSTFNGAIQNGSSAGTLTKTGTGALTLTGSGTQSNTVVQGGTLALAATSELTGNAGVTGGTLTNNGVIDGLTTITGGLAKGAGNYAGGYSLQSGGSILFGNSPGTLRSGSATWNGGTVRFQINNATGTAGTNWGYNDISGSLSLVSAANPLTITLESLLASGTAGSLANFDPTQNYTWDIAHSLTGISGFETANIILDDSAFTSYNAGIVGSHFSLARLGNTLSLKYANVAIIVPELGTGWLALLGGVGIGFGATLRRKQIAS